MMLDTLELEFCDGELNLSPLQEQQEPSPVSSAYNARRLTTAATS
ncbi:mCG142636, partial [Mus musculus]